MAAALLVRRGRRASDPVGCRAEPSVRPPITSGDLGCSFAWRDQQNGLPTGGPFRRFRFGVRLVAEGPAALLGAAVRAGARLPRGDDAAGALLGAAVLAGAAGRVGRARLRRRAGVRVTVVVGGEDHDGGGEADDGDYRDCEHRASVPVVGAEYRGMLSGDSSPMTASCPGRPLGGSPACVVGSTCVPIVHGCGCGAATGR